MPRLPVVVGFGGINSAGRSSFHQGYRRMVLDALPAPARHKTLSALAHLMQLHDMPAHEKTVLQHTLIRRIETHHFDVDAVPMHSRLQLDAEALTFRLRKQDLPHTISPRWLIRAISDQDVEVIVPGGLEVLLPDQHSFPVSSAGQLPAGFDPSRFYAARQHPRALQMTVVGANDALHSLGVEWESLRQHLATDRIAVYASSAHGQLDDAGTGGLLKFPWQSKRTTAKQCPLGFAGMAGDFINAYILGSAGRTGSLQGACATFLYNLERAVTDIRDGRVDFALVGAAEAPILPEVMEGYRAMGALAEDAKLLELDRARGATTLDNRRATRPFGYNAGFTMAESAQFVVLTSDTFALEQGLPIHASVPGVFIHADGYKKSISSPGIGNYLTFGKAAGLARELLGEQALRTRTYVHAHGTGTPQNRVTESHILDTIAGAFGIEQWLVASIKCYVGHSLGAAAGDQFMAALGAWAEGWVPGIFTLDEIAHDVHREHLRFSRDHVECGREAHAACLLNAKGFGGNNATALLVSPPDTERLLARRHGNALMTQWQQQRAASEPERLRYEAQTDRGDFRILYRFGEHVLAGVELDGPDRIRLAGQALSVSLKPEVSFDDYR